jgi:hypothetical protein
VALMLLLAPGLPNHSHQDTALTLLLAPDLLNQSHMLNALTSFFRCGPEAIQFNNF